MKYKKYVIISDLEKDDVTEEPLFWNQDDGWTILEGATIFKRKPTSLPLNSMLLTLPEII